MSFDLALAVSTSTIFVRISQVTVEIIEVDEVQVNACSVASKLSICSTGARQELFKSNVNFINFSSFCIYKLRKLLR